MRRGLSSVATRSCKKARIRRRGGWSSVSTSRTAAWSSSIIHAIACHHVVEWDGVRFSEPEVDQPLFGQGTRPQDRLSVPGGPQGCRRSCSARCGRPTGAGVGRRHRASGGKQRSCRVSCVLVAIQVTHVSHAPPTPPRRVKPDTVEKQRGMRGRMTSLTWARSTCRTESQLAVSVDTLTKPDTPWSWGASEIGK